MTGPLNRCSAAFGETEIDGEVVLLSLADGTFFSLTGTAAEIWSLIDGTHTRDALISALALRHDEVEAEIAPDVDAYLAQLIKAGFVTAG